MSKVQLVGGCSVVGSNICGCDDDESTQAIVDVVKSYWQAYLLQDSATLRSLFLDDDDSSNRNFLLISQQTGRRVQTVDEALNVLHTVWTAYETNQADRSLAMNMNILQLRMETASSNTTTKVYYWLEVEGGIRWEFDDSVYVSQILVNHQNNDGGSMRIAFHADMWGLNYDPLKPDQTTTEVDSSTATFDFHFVYPVQNLERATQFYLPCPESGASDTILLESYGSSRVSIDYSHVLSVGRTPHSSRH